MSFNLRRQFRRSVAKLTIGVLVGLLMTTGCTTRVSPPVATILAKKPPKKITLPSPDDYSEGKTISNAHWKWVATLQPSKNNFDSPLLDNYLLELKNDGWFNVVAPCFRGDGMYELGRGGRIAFALLHSYPGKKCASTPGLELFLKTLESSSSYREDGERFSLYDKRAKTTLIFLRQGE